MKTKRDWIKDCEHKARHILARRLAAQDEVDRLRPKRRAAPLDQWIVFYAQLVRLLGRGDFAPSQLEHGEADAEGLAALNAQPIRVRLMMPDANGAAQTVEVHPKSFDVLRRFFAVRDWLLTHLADRVSVIRADGQMTDAPLLERSEAELSYQTRLVEWAACTAGVGIPFAFTDERPEIPEPFASLMPYDMLRIHEAYLRVNAGQLQALDRLVSPTKEGSAQRPSFSIFFGQLAIRFKVPADRLMRDYPLAQLLATVKLGAPQGVEEDELEEAAA